MHRSPPTTHQRATRWLLVCSIVSSSGCLLLVDPPLIDDDEDDADSDSDSSPPTTGWVDLAMGYSNVCAIDTHGAMWCGWGLDDLGLFDVGPFVSISRDGWGEVCGVLASGSLICDFVYSDGFTLTEGYTAVSGSSEAGCGLKTSGAARCWPEANDVPGPFQSIGAGGTFACGIRAAGSLQCWGIDSLVFDEPLDVPAGSYTQVATYDDVGCALSTGGNIVCWGYDFSGLLPPPSGTYVDLSINGDGCAVSTSGSITCWGDNAGDPNHAHLFPPEGIEFSKVSVGSELSCGIATDTTLHCW